MDELIKANVLGYYFLFIIQKMVALKYEADEETDLIKKINNLIIDVEKDVFILSEK